MPRTATTATSTGCVPATSVAAGRADGGRAPSRRGRSALRGRGGTGGPRRPLRRAYTPPVGPGRDRRAGDGRLREACAAGGAGDRRDHRGQRPLPARRRGGGGGP